MADYFKGVRYICEVPETGESKEVDNYNDAMAFVTKQNNVGKSVQVTRHYWLAHKSPDGWFPVRNDTRPRTTN